MFTVQEKQSQPKRPSLKGRLSSW